MIYVSDFIKNREIVLIFFIIIIFFITLINYLWGIDNPKILEMDTLSIKIGILTASASILAIAFVVTQIIISHASEKYSPFVIDLYWKDWYTKIAFISLIIITAVCAIFAGIQYTTESIPIDFLIVISIIGGFLISLTFFTWHFYQLFKIVNPISLIGQLKILFDKNRKLLSEKNQKTQFGNYKNIRGYCFKINY